MTAPDITPVRLTAPAKLTLSLRVTGVRDDGLHTIDAEMITVDLADVLELRPRPLDGADERPSSLQLADTPQAAGLTTGADNLVLQALALAGRAADVTLTKNIPSEAGLGGGSAVASAILRWAGLSDPVQAALLGADVAFCLRGGRARVTGIGEQIEPLPFEANTVTILTPPLRCPTAKVFRAWDELGGPTGPGANDLEQAALRVEPRLDEWRQRLAEETGQNPQLAGSGSSWFVRGAFPGAGRSVARAIPAC
jgi:4-diphosphocytidyl-2-C-methyl-D-erythritol kinase